MKEKVILINYTGRNGGGVLDAFEMTKALCQLGEPVVAVVSKEISNYSDWEKLSLKKLVAIDTYHSMKSFVINTLKFPLSLKRYIKSELSDFSVEYIYCPMGTLWTGLITKCFPRAKQIMVLHDPIMHSGGNVIEAKIFARNIRKSAAVIVHTKKFVQYVSDLYQLPTYYIPLGRHNIYRTCENKVESVVYDQECINYMFFGRITEYKGLDTLGEAYRTVCQELGANQKMSLTIVGNGDFSLYESVFNGLPNVNAIIRWIDDNEVESVFTGKNLINICPYKDATQSGVVLVAMDYGIPCIVTRTGGLDEQIADGVTGLIVEPNNANELARAMITLATDKELYESIRKNELSQVEDMTWEKAANKLIEIMKE